MSRVVISVGEYSLPCRMEIEESIDRKEEALPVREDKRVMLTSRKFARVKISSVPVELNSMVSVTVSGVMLQWRFTRVRFKSTVSQQLERGSQEESGPVLLAVMFAWYMP